MNRIAPESLVEAMSRIVILFTVTALCVGLPMVVAGTDVMTCIGVSVAITAMLVWAWVWLGKNP